MAELKQSINTVQINGTLAEMNLKEETKEVTLKRKINGSDVEKKVKCKTIGKTVFSNPSFVVESNGNLIKVEYFGINFGIHEFTLNDDGEVVENDKFKAISTIVDKYVPKSKCKSDEEPTRVMVRGKLGLNEYASTKKNPDGIFYSNTEIVAFSLTSSNVSEEDSADAEISGVIKNMRKEEKNDTETGRLLVDFVSFGYNGVAEPYEFVVEEDLADDFESFYEIGASAKIAFEVKTKQVGTVRVSSGGGFGRRDAKITSGYAVQEYSIFRGEDPYDEEAEYFVDVETVKNALNEREIMKAEKIEKAVNDSKNGGASSATKSSSPKSATSSSGNNPFGGGAKRANPFA